MARIVMFVLNDVRRDARVLREAETLAAAGHEVTIVGRPADTANVALDRERHGDVTIIRVPVPGRLRRRLLAAGGSRVARGAGGATPGGSPGRDAGRGRSPVRLLVDAARSIGRWPVIGEVVRGLEFLARWRLGILAWARAAAMAAPAADAWHGHDLTGLAAAAEARRRRGGVVVYDSHELYLEAGGIADQPAWVRAVLRREERAWARQAARVITVNEGVADLLGPRLGVRRPVVVMNAQPSWDPPEPQPDHVRTALALPPGTPVVLYHGGFLPDRGIPELIAAMRSPGLESAHLVLMGWGPLEPEIRRQAADPGAGGRVHLLPPVAPSELLEWVASTDVGAMPNQPRTLNERLTTPNKLFECLAAGVPVVSSDFAERRRMLVDDPDGPLGELCDPTDPAAIGAAIRRLLELAPAARTDLRDRCRRAARARINWEQQAERLRAVYADLDLPPDTRPGDPAAIDPAAGGPTADRSAGRRPPPGVDPQRITFVLPSSGAWDSRTRRMAVSLAARGHDVLVLARAEADLPDREVIAPGAVLRRVDAGVAPTPTPPHLRGLRRALAEAGRIARTAGRTRAQSRGARAVDRPADLYHAMGFLALPVAVDLAGRAGAPFVYDARDLYVEGNNVARLPRPLRAAFARRERSWARRAAAVATVNDALAAELARRLGVERPVVVLNAQDGTVPPGARPDRLRAELSIATGAPVVLYHGGFMRDRGLPELVQAMRTPALAAAHLVLMGAGALEAELRRLASAADLGGRVHLLPPVPPHELLAWVASADVGVMPNQPRTVNERLSTPNKLFECLAAGTPVVSSDFPERRRIIVDDPDGPLGALCDPTDPESIAAAVRSILDLDPGAAAALRARCLRAASTRYAWSTQLEALLGLYTRVTGRPW
jgi:glycosyltransferase involved in cell wall biosynthesis